MSVQHREIVGQERGDGLLRSEVGHRSLCRFPMTSNLGSTHAAISLWANAFGSFGSTRKPFASSVINSSKLVPFVPITTRPRPIASRQLLGKLSINEGNTTRRARSITG